MYRILPRQLIRTSNYISVNYNFCKFFGLLTNKFNVHPITSNLVNYRNSNCRKFKNSLYRSCATVSETITLLSNAYEERGRICASTILSILENSTTELIQNDRELTLLQCCGHILVDQTFQERSALVDKVWKKLEECSTNFSVDHYNTYLQMAIENRTSIDFKTFLSKMKCTPNEETYRLLLDCVCQAGDVSQAVNIVEEMKNKRYRAGERLFNALVLAHAIRGGLNDVKRVLETMQTARVTATPATYVATIRGLAERPNQHEFVEALEMLSDVISEQEFLQILLGLGLKGNHLWVQEITKLWGLRKLSKMGSLQLELLCIQLIYMKKPEAAMSYYKTFVEPESVEDEGDYGFILLSEMLPSSTPTSQIISIAKDLQESQLNQFALEKITGLALKQGSIDVALKLLEVLPNLRPHYFWPLLLNSSRHSREIGVLDILKKMLQLSVQPDMDTIEFYCLPYCDLSNPKNLITRLQGLGFTQRELLTPMVAFLIKECKLDPALKLCQEYRNITVLPERLLKPLIAAWSKTKDTRTIAGLLSKIQTFSNSDYNGQFLLRCLRLCPARINHSHYLNLVKEMQIKELKISSSVADTLMYQLKFPKHQCAVNSEIQDIIDALVNASVHHINNHITHPRNMNLTELECHFIELQNKNKETRGVLRRLIQEHCRQGNENHVKKLRQQFVDIGYEETSGMKAVLLFTYVESNNITGALRIYKEIKETDPDFFLDDFKILNLATLLVVNNKFNMALEVLSEQKKVRGGSAVVRNCWQLLRAVSNETELLKLFNLLVEKGYCTPSNILLGPFVKIHLNKGNLDEAVKMYTTCAEKYNCTPLQIELLNALVASEKDELLQQVLNVTSKVHGSEPTTASLIAALAQNGLQNSLRKLLMEIKVVPKKEIVNKCKYWVYENNVSALETLAHVVLRLPSGIMDRSIIYHSIMQIHSNNNDCESALKFYQQLLQNEERIPERLIDELLKLAHRCNYKIPKHFAIKRRNS